MRNTQHTYDIKIGILLFIEKLDEKKREREFSLKNMVKIMTTDKQINKINKY